MPDRPDTLDEQKALLEKFSAAVPSRGGTSAQTSANPASIPEAWCVNHRDVKGVYYCKNCRSWRCKTCQRTFDGVAVCTDCDCLAIQASDLQTLTAKAVEEAKPYSSHLIRAVTYPVRHFVFTLGAFAAVWLSGGLIEALSRSEVYVPLSSVLTGPMAGWSGTAVAFIVAGAIAMTRLMARANGQESWKWEQFSDFNLIGEPVACWIAAAAIGIAPLVIDLWFHKFRILMVALIAGINVEEATPQPSLGRWIGICFFSLWALFYYPMSMVVAAIRKGVLPILNPLSAIWAWLGLKRWLLPAFGIAALLGAVAALVVYLFGERPGGLAIYSAALTVVNLVTAQVLAAAVCEGVDKVNLEGTVRIRLPEFISSIFR
jgi:hypothetical protein